MGEARNGLQTTGRRHVFSIYNEKLRLAQLQKISEAIHCFYQQLGEDITDARMDPGDDDATLKRFVNFHSFLAHLVNSGMCLATSEDALRTMRRVFEESTEIQDAWVMGAAQWILWSG